MRTRTRLSLTLGLVLAALTAALLPWWQPQTPPTAQGTQQSDKSTDTKPVSTGPRDETAAVAEARRAGKQVLVDTATTATEMTWALPNGQMRTQIHALAQRAKNAEGRWAPIDNKLTRTKKAPRGLGIAPVNPAVPVRLADGSGGSAESAEKSRADRSYVRAPQPGESVLAEIDIKGHTLAYTWPGALPEPVLEGPRALYPEVLPGVDLLLVVREEGGLGQLLIVKSREAAQQPALKTISYGLRSPMAVFRQDEAHGQVLVEDAKGTEIGSIPTPFAWDSAGRDPEVPDDRPTPLTSTATSADVLRLSGLSGAEPGALRAPVPLSVEGDGTGTARLRLDTAATGLLTGEDVTFPVFVDPTINPGWQAWTVAYRPYPNTSFYNGTNFSSGTSDARVGHENDTGGTARSFWRIGFSKSLKGATISKASFKVLNNHSWSCTNREFQFWLTGSISSGTTWNSQPKWTTELDRKSFAHGWSSADCPDEYEAFDVKAAAQKGADNGSSNLTFGMRATSESDTQTWRKFKATSATMEVTYNRNPTEPVDGETVPGGDCLVGSPGRTVGKTNLVLKAKATDPDGNLKGLRFRFWKVGAATPAGTLATNLSGGWASTTIPSTSLADKATYYWDVRAEDSITPAGVSTYFPPGTTPCAVTVDGSAPPPPTVTSEVFKRATNDGATWATVKFGGTGAITFASEGAAKFRFGFEGLNYTDVTATGGAYTKSDLKPPHAGPNWLHVFSLDATGNVSARTDYAFYVPPKEAADSPGDVGGDGIADLLAVNASGNLLSFPGSTDGELYGSMAGAYTSGNKLNPAGHWYDATAGKPAPLISHYQDVYPGDGLNDLFARTPDGGFWLYPGDGYGTFNVDDRMRIRLPSNAPAPSTWTQLKAVGDVTGDKLPDVFVRAGTAYWALIGYTGATFQQAIQMNSDSWARRDIVNVADIDLDGTPDLLWRNLDLGSIYVRHGKPGATAGSVDLNSLTTAANSRDGDVSYGGSWTEANISTAIGIPDVNNDNIPDIWARFASDGHVSIYHPSTTNTNAPVKTVSTENWNAYKTFG
ncbi:DNRLRE domain-containing protein [Streptomyces sp. NBC_01317]|uniref:DNRLRE domain-containing protein n=1 Tax=Streptomyces sp. NBC_01317 TaxID=2903822 RepID=UPI002E12DDA7|nr:DNRLRE domain-containing protein [Streptomyces sp. NBC_01317]